MKNNLYKTVMIIDDSHWDRFISKKLLKRINLLKIFSYSLLQMRLLKA